MEVSIQPLFDHRIVTGRDALRVMRTDLEMLPQRKWVILCDEHTAAACYPLLLKEVDMLNSAALLTVPAGEEHKTLEQATIIWKELSKMNLERKDGLLNLGGGMITDLGGFVASNYLRGIPFLNVPTSLLAQVDAAIGGKTGVDLDHVKNRIGTFSFPMAVYSWPGFFSSLPDAEWESACAEVIKHALVAREDVWLELSELGLTRQVITERLPVIQQVKLDVVKEDPHETGRRKILNFGHTMGHALESEGLSIAQPIRHGDAVAWGMIMELQIAAELGWMNQVTAEGIIDRLLKMFSLPDISGFNPEALMQWIRMDKKNVQGTIRMSLLKEIGHCTWNVETPPRVVRSVFEKYCKG